MKLKAKHVFISYAVSDGNEIAVRIHDDLEKEKIPAWIDVKDIPDGSDWDREIDLGIQNSLAIAVVITPGSVLSLQVKSEWNYGLNQFIPVIPILVGECEVPRILQTLNYIQFTDYNNGFRRLKHRIMNLEEDHLSYLLQLQKSYILAQSKSPNPKRFDYKIDKLQAVIDRLTDDYEHTEVDLFADIGLGGTRTISSTEKDFHELDIRKQTIVIGTKPVDIQFFLNREQECLTLKRLLLDPSTKVISIIARGGMGKTALATKVLNEIADNGLADDKGNILQTESIIYQSIRTSGISLERLFLDFGEANRDKGGKDILEFWTNIALNVDEKIERLIEALEKQSQIIILLDNFEDLLDNNGKLQSEEIMKFFNKIFFHANNIKIIITSRIRPSFDSNALFFIREIPLAEGLSENDGVTMLRALDPYNDSGLKTDDTSLLASAVRTVRGIPRALQVLASILLNDPFVTLEDLLTNNKILNHQAFTDYLIVENYKRLDQDSRHVILMLSIFGKPVPVSAIEFMLKDKSLQINIKEILKRLAQSHIVIIDRSTKLVQLHPIDQDHISTQLPSRGTTRRNDLEKQAATYYLEQQTEIDDWNSLDDLEPFLMQFDHLLRAEDYKEAALVLNYLDFNFLFEKSYFERILSMRRSINANLEDTKLREINLGRIGQCLSLLSDYDEASKYLNAAIALSNSSQNNEYLPLWLNTLGRIEHDRSNYDLALKYFLNSLDVTPSQNIELIAENLGHIGRLYRSKGSLDEAIKYLEQSVIGLNESTNLRILGSLKGHLGYAYRLVGRYIDAEEHLKKSLSIAQKVSNKSEIQERQSNLAGLQLEFGNFEKALLNYQAALSLVQEIGSKRDIAKRLAGVGRAYHGLGDYELARDYHEKSLVIAQDIGARMIQSYQLYNLGIEYTSLGKLQQAISTFEEGIRIAQDLGSLAEVNKHSIKLAKVFLFMDNPQKAADILLGLKSIQQLPDIYHELEVIYAISLVKLRQYDEVLKLIGPLVKYFDQKIQGKSYRIAYMQVFSFCILSCIPNQHIDSDTITQQLNKAIEMCNARGVLDEFGQLLKTLDNCLDEELYKVLNKQFS